MRLYMHLERPFAREQPLQTKVHLAAARTSHVDASTITRMQNFGFLQGFPVHNFAVDFSGTYLSHCRLNLSTKTLLLPCRSRTTEKRVALTSCSFGFGPHRILDRINLAEAWYHRVKARPARMIQVGTKDVPFSMLARSIRLRLALPSPTVTKKKRGMWTESCEPDKTCGNVTA